MSSCYLDTSAAVKLLVTEQHSDAMAELFRGVEAAWVSSVLLRIELTRAVRRVAPALLDGVRELFGALDFLAIDDEVVNAAMAETMPDLRSLEAIHLASARLLGTELDAVVTYDERLAAAARAVGFYVLTPTEGSGEH